MKSEKTKKTDAIWTAGIVIYIITMIISVFLPEMLHLYDDMIGTDGLKNIIAAITLEYFSRFIFAIPGVIVIMIFIIDFFKKKKKINKPFHVFSILLIAACTILLFGLTKTRFNEQQSNKNISGPFAEARLCIRCISDLFTDDYDEFTVNDCYVDRRKHLSSRGRGRSNYHSEYTANFYYDKKIITEIQIGREDRHSDEMIPAKFDTKITVYKKSGFLRSVEPTVDFDRSGSYEHFITISFSGDQIVYEKIIDVDYKSLQWGGFRKNESYDIQNELFGIGVSEERPSLNADYIGSLCDEVCLYAVVDGKYRRVSNILTKDEKK